MAITRTRTRAFSQRHPIVLILVPALAAVFLASACGKASTGAPAQTSQPAPSQSSQSVATAQASTAQASTAQPSATQASVIAPGHATPEDAVTGLIQAELADNDSLVCSYLVPSSQATCNEQAQQQPLPPFTGSPAVAGGIISGSEALVSVTGTICASGGTCAGNSDPGQGMPDVGETFAQAYDQALSSSGSFSPIPCIEENGMWYANTLM
jgi:hypothetical protein